MTGFNPRLLSKSAVPKNYDDYLRPQFKSQIAVNRGVPYPLTGMVSLRGDEQGMAYFKKLSQQDLRLVEGYSHTINMMAAGEYPLTGFMQVSKLEAMKRKEAPVDWVPRPDPGDDFHDSHGEKSPPSGGGADSHRFLSFR